MSRKDDDRAARLAAIQAKISARDPDEANAAISGLGRKPALALGILRNKITLGPDGITWRKRTYPVKGARAEVSDFRSGLAGRKHTADLTITLASGEVLAWHQTDTGSMARLAHNQAVRFAAAVNSAATRAG
jgi:hypothetical protein